MHDEQLRALGRVIVNFQACEIHIAFLTWQLIGAGQDVGPVLTSQLPFGKLCRVCLALFEIRETDSDLRARLRDLVKRAQKAEQRRNALFHSAWTAPAHPDETSSMRIKFTVRKGKLQVAQEEVDASELNTLGDELRALGEDIGLFMRDANEHGSITFPSGPEGE